jgi:predicted nucleic-acid-binding Zn-ribbon protein
MNDTIVNFESVKECIKCGRKIYHHDNTCLANRTFIPPKLENNNIVQEHLDVSCPFCGYTWQEQCKE